MAVTAIVRLGNTAPVEAYYEDDDAARDGVVSRRVLDIGNAVTTFNVHADDLIEAITTVTRAFLSHHSNDPPEWVESDNDVLAAAIADHFSADGHKCVVGRPKSWKGLE